MVSGGFGVVSGGFGVVSGGFGMVSGGFGVIALRSGAGDEPPTWVGPRMRQEDAFVSSRMKSAVLGRFPATRAVVALAVTLSLLGSMQPAAGGWKVTEEIRDGLKWVHNPATPKEGSEEIRLRERWRLGGDDEEDELFGVVSSVFKDDQGNICLLDSQLSEIRIYNPDGELLRSMGGPGEGPGEFQGAGGACLLPGGGFAAVQTWPGKLVMFKPDGDPASTLVPRITGENSTMGFLVIFGAAAVGENLGIACMNQTFTQGTLRRNHVLGVFDLEGNQLARLFDIQEEADMSHGIPIDEKSSGRFQRRWVVAPDSTIYAVAEFYGYEIHVFDSRGQAQLVIEREYERLRRTPEEKQFVEEIIAGGTRMVPNAQITVEDSHQDITALQMGPDGMLWVRSSMGIWRVPDGVLGVYDIFSPDGYYIRQVTLRAEGNPREDAVYMLGDRVVVVRSFMSSLMGALGGSEYEEEEDLEEEGVTIICYDM
ncbi:MAG: hypothetical protein KAY24_04080 [Candidatus Eisenbacteria sp.]|nr:hypothetical protein [Candidatus Eisenbacteria bacterium]